MKKIELPDFIFPVIIFLGIEPIMVTILVYKSDEQKIVFGAWFHDGKASLSVMKDYHKWIELKTGKETEMSRAIGLAIDNTYGENCNFNHF